MKKSFLILFVLIGCANQNKEIIDIGEISILEYPRDKELRKWIELDSQYAKVYQVRRYFENFVNDDFFEEKNIKEKFNKLSWSDMLNYQKRYTQLLSENQKKYYDNKSLTKYVDSLIMIEYPIIDEFTKEIFALDYD